MPYPTAHVLRVGRFEFQLPTSSAFTCTRPASWRASRVHLNEHQLNQMVNDHDNEILTGCAACQLERSAFREMASIQEAQHVSSSPNKFLPVINRPGTSGCAAQYTSCAIRLRLTLRSSGHAAACHAWPSFHSGPCVPCRCVPLTSNVRRIRTYTTQPLMCFGSAALNANSHTRFSKRSFEQEPMSSQSPRAHR